MTYILKESIARELSIEESADGLFYYVVKEGTLPLTESGLFYNREECVREGIKYLDILHRESPMRSDYIPSVVDYVTLLKGGKT